MSFRMGLAPVAACCALLVVPRPAAAQTKVAIVNLQQAIIGTAEIKKAESELQAKYTPRQAEMDKTNAEITKLNQQIQTGQDTLAPQALADLSSTLARRQRDLQRLQEDYQADFERDRNEILSGATQRMGGVVVKLAEEKGLDLVLEATTAYYSKDSLNITNDAIAAYDKAYPVAAAPAAPAKPAGK